MRAWSMVLAFELVEVYPLEVVWLAALLFRVVLLRVVLVVVGRRPEEGMEGRMVWRVGLLGGGGMLSEVSYRLA